MKGFLKRNIVLIIGVIIGAIAGYYYWKYVGCNSGGCMITSRPVNSTIFGGLLGGMVFSLFTDKEKEK